MNSKKDYTGYASLIAILVIVFLAAASRIPGTKIGEVKARQLKMLLKERCGREYDISGLPID